jgi:DNA gyrase subunit A
VSETLPPAAVAGDTWVAALDGAVPIADLAPGARPGALADVDVKVVGLHGAPVRGVAVHHAGTHTVLAVVAGERELRCTPAQPLLSRVLVGGEAVLMWRPAEELAPGDLLAVAEPCPALVAAPRPDAAVVAVDPACAVLDGPEVGLFAWVPVSLVAAIGEEPVYALRVDAPDHAYVTDGFVSHGAGLGRTERISAL